VLQEVLLGSARGIVVAAGVVLWALTLVRRRWARLVLMAVFTVTGVISLVTMSTNGIPESFTSLAGAGLTVGLVLAMSADAVREWVSVGRKERHVDVSLHGVSIH
jgi:prepilin signal peptidase PulO-like enzyme (type II secretory pathway)